MIGQLIDGKYQIVKLLGEGGMGAVYEARHSGTGRRVALKVIVSNELARSQEVVTRFQREAKAAGAIDTQHIVQVLDSGRDPVSGFPFMVMEFLAGKDVQQLVQTVGPLPPDLALRIAAQACIGLQKAHDAEVVHRDIKPANLFLSRRDEGEIVVKVLDFGIAKVKMEQASSTEGHGLTRTGSILGSPLYMSPEQAKGLRTIDGRTDVWSLGAVLYEALSGLTPHHRVDTLGQLILAICSESPPPLQQIAPWVPPEVAAIVHGALQIDVAARFQSAKAMLDAIMPCLPNGIALNDRLLTGVTPEQRAFVAPRLSMSYGGGPNSRPLGGTQLLPGAAGITDHGVTGPGALSSTAVRTPPKRSAALPVMLGALLLGGAAAVAIFSFRAKAPHPVEVATAAAPLPEASAAPSAAASAPETPSSADKTVTVAIAPASASVELDGAPVDAKDGTLEIKGPLGSVHHVRVFHGARETRSDVVIGAAGAVPPKIELGAAAVAAPKSGNAKATVAPASAAPAHPAASSAPASRTFD